MAEVDVTPKEYINELSSNEKKELFELLAKNLKKNVDDELEMIKNKEKDKQQVIVTEYLRDLSEFELKKVLVNVLYVPSYSDDDALRNALESIVTAR